MVEKKHVLAKTYTTPQDSDFGTYAIIEFDRELMERIIKLRSEFVMCSRKLKKLGSSLYEWKLWDGHVTWFDSGTGGDWPGEGFMNFGDILDEKANHRLPIKAPGKKRKKNQEALVEEVEAKLGRRASREEFVVLPDGFELNDEEARSDMDMMILDERGIFFTACDHYSDTRADTIEFTYEQLYELMGT